MLPVVPVVCQLVSPELVPINGIFFNISDNEVAFYVYSPQRGAAEQVLTALATPEEQYT